MLALQAPGRLEAKMTVAMRILIVLVVFVMSLSLWVSSVSCGGDVASGTNTPPMPTLELPSGSSHFFDNKMAKNLMIFVSPETGPLAAMESLGNCHV